MACRLRFIATLLGWLRRSPAGRDAEIVYLWQQLIVLKRSAPARPKLRATDRLIFVCLYRLFPSLLDASIVFKPVTLPCEGHRKKMLCVLVKVDNPSDPKKMW